MAEPVKHNVRKISESVAALREAYPAVGGLGWNFDGFRVWVESNEPALLDALAEYFHDFRRLEADSLAAAEAGGELTRITTIQCDPPDFGADRTMTIGEYKPSVKGPKEAYYDVADGRVVHKLRTGMWFLFGRDDHLAIGPCTGNPNQVINFVNNRMIQWSLHRGALLGHASAVCRVEDGSASEEPPPTIAIAGFSGMGKSTLSLKLMNDRRVDYLSNDRVMIGPPRQDEGAGELVIQGVPKHPRINPGTILNNPDLVGLLDDQERAEFEALPSDELWRLEDKYDGLIRTCFPDQRFFLRGRLVGLVLLNWTREGGETIARRIDLRHNTKLLPALIKKPGVFYLSGPGQAESRDIARYLEYLDGVEVLELAGGIDFDAGRRAALELLFG
jgi:HprK-related kinase B